MYHLSKVLLLTVSLTLAVKVIGGQTPDSFDTLYTRGAGEMLVPVYDTVKQLEKANAKADTIMSDLEHIKAALGIIDTIKCKRK